VPPKKHIIIIGVLCVIALASGYWVGLPKEGSGGGEGGNDEGKGETAAKIPGSGEGKSGGDNTPDSLKQGLVAYYPFNGNAKDESGNGHDGEVSGAVLTADRHGKSAKAFSFDGTNDYIKITDHPSLQLGSTGTFSLWALSRSITGRGPFICKDGTGYNDDLSIGFNWHGGNFNKLTFAFQRSPQNDLPFIADPNNFVTKQWTFIVGAWDDSGFSLYRDSQLIGYKATAVECIAAGHHLYFGAQMKSSYIYYTNCALDDIRIYNRALSEAEVKELYEFEKPKTQQASMPTPIKVVPNSPAATAAIEAAIRMAASKPTGELTKADFDKVKALHGITAKKLTDISVLAKMEWMTSLDLGGNLLTDGQLEHFVGLKKLKHLRLNENRLKDISALAGLTQLELLHLNGNLISDVSALKELKQLQTLSLHDNPDLTKAQIDQLQKALPKCEIQSNTTK
jgi:hypothetical protein